MRGRPAAVLAAAALVCLGLAPGSAAAALSWGGPLAVDQHGGQSPGGIACPAADQCTAVDGHGEEVTFDPAAPGTPTPHTIDPGNGLTGVACPSSTQCDAVDSAGNEVTFDPAHPDAVMTMRAASDGLRGVSCPSTSECVAVGGTGVEATFQPGTMSQGTVLDGGARLEGVSCPTTAECTAIDLEGRVVTFEPGLPGNPTAVATGLGTSLGAIACPSATLCSAVDVGGREVSFDPAAPGTPVAVTIDAGEGFQDLACWSTGSCIAVGSGGQEVSFDPGSPGGATVHSIDAGQFLFDVACSAADRCTALDGFDRALGFDPAAPGTPDGTTLAYGTPVRDLSCPAAGQCTAIDLEGREVTFDPAAPGGLSHAEVDPGTDGVMFAISCPSTTQCTVVDDDGRELTFDPASVGTPTPRPVDYGVPTAISCPSTSQCTEVDDVGLETTFDPTAPGTPAGHSIHGSEAWEPTGVSCPSTTQCTAVDIDGREVTFDPTAPGTPAPHAVDAGGGGLAGVSCPSAAQCTAVDFHGQEVTFDPASPGSPTPDQVAQGGAGDYLISCPSTGFCAITDSFGQVVEGDPTAASFSSQALSRASFAQGISCASSSSCVVADELGDAYLGTPATGAASSIRFSIVNPEGVPQFAHYIVRASGDAPPVATDWWTAESTTTPGEALISVVPGDTVYFDRTANVSEMNGALVPPEGERGEAYQVTASTPGGVTVTMPSSGSVFHPALSGAEEWLIGQLNQRRVAAGAPALQVSTTLSEAASEEARDEAVNHRWPDPYFFVVNQDRGWPGDILAEDYAEADAPLSDPQRVLTHWDGDPSDPESPGIWQALSDPSLRYVGIGDGAGAWIIQATDGCPDLADLSACGLTRDTGDTGAWEPTAIAIDAPADGHTYTQGEAVAASYTCTSPAPAGVAVAGCAGPVAAGQPIDTATAGAHSFTVTATDANGDTTTRTVEYEVAAGAAPPIVTPSAEPVSIGAPSISGNAVVGSTLTGLPGSWTASPTHFVYEWLRCPSADNRDGCQTMAADDLPASAGSDRYAVADGDYGSYIVLEVKGVNDAGYNAAFSSPMRVQATPPSLDPSRLPTVSGPSQPHVGDVLTASPGGWRGTQPMLLSYGWLRCPDTVIAHCVGAATSSDAHYTLARADVGRRMLLVVTAHNSSGQSAKAFAASFTGVVEESASTLGRAAEEAESAAAALGPVSGDALLAGKEVEVKLGGPGIVDLLGSSKLIPDKGLGLTQQEVDKLIAEIESGLISDKGLGLIGDQLVSDKGLGLVTQNGPATGVLSAGTASAGVPFAGKAKHVERPQPLFAGAHKFKHAGKGKIKLRLTKAGRATITSYERRATGARRHGHKPKPLRITLVTIAGPLAGHGDAVFHLRTITIQP